MVKWTKRNMLTAIALGIPLGFGGMAATDAVAESVLRVIPHADLKPRSYLGV